MDDISLSRLWKKYDEFCARGLKLNMARGCPSREQLDLSVPMLHMEDTFICEDGSDVRNYGDVTGIPEAKRLFGELLGMPHEQVIIGGSSSINLIYDALTRAWIHGPMDGDTPWCRLPKAKFITPEPGYDWHFRMLKMLGIECVGVPLLNDGPDMDAVRELIKDPLVKGIICVPMYSNPSGVTYSDEKVTALASMQTAASDFRIIWDNAYCVHHLYPEPENQDRLLNIYDACVKFGNPDRVLMFASTSKLTFAGCGISAMAASPANIARHTELLHYQLVSYDRLNQLRHVRFLRDKATVEAHMRKHADIIRPKFELVLRTFERELSDIAEWTKPRGGYFICFEAPDGCAKRIVELCARAGVTLTPAGSPYIDGIDRRDRTLRIAPTLPPIEDLEKVMEIFPTAVRIAAAEAGKL